jgi:hypothetical protein
MKLNRKGEGGFMESIIAVMVIVISLTAFLSFLAFSVSHEVEREPDVPTEVIGGVRIVSGMIETDAEGNIVGMIERGRYQGMRLTLSVNGIYNDRVTLSAGSFDSDNIVSRTGSVIAETDGGRRVPVQYSLAVWI